MEPPVDAVVFDVFGTLLDVTSVEARCASVSPDPAAFSLLWRQKQLEYTWLRTLMDRYEDFWSVTGAALDHVLERFGAPVSAEERAGLLDAWLALDAYPDVAGALSFGFRVAWVNRAGVPGDGLGPAPDLVVSDLGELAAQLS
jgi:2-haloacid dehalogenase